MTTTLDQSYVDYLQLQVRRHTQAVEPTRWRGLAIHAGRETIQFLDDMPYPFVANPLFKAWLPLDQHPECWLIFEPGMTPRVIYYQPADYWHTVPEDPEGVWAEQLDVVVIRTPQEARNHLPEDLRDFAYMGEFGDSLADWGFGGTNPSEIINYLSYHRAYKHEYELACMREASVCGARAHMAAERAARAGKSEFGIHLDYMAAVNLAEKELPYGNIIALNNHGAVLHYHDLERNATNTSRSFLIDAGGSFNGYVSDITRTYNLDGDARFGDLLERMETAQLELVDGARAGVDYRDLHVTAHEKIAAVLSDMKIAKGSVDSLVESGVTRTFFPHGLGHSIGLQVHDVGGFLNGTDGTLREKPVDHPFLRLTRTLETDFVVTIEPGLYFIPMLLDELKQTKAADCIDWDIVEKLIPYGGVRIEDDVAITHGTPENLTRDAFAALS